MNDEPDEQPLFNSLDAMILHERRLNEGRAADGLSAAPGVKEALVLRMLTMLNEKLEHDLGEVARHMAESLLPPPTIH